MSFRRITTVLVGFLMLIWTASAAWADPHPAPQGKPPAGSPNLGPQVKPGPAGESVGQPPASGAPSVQSEPAASPEVPQGPLPHLIIPQPEFDAGVVEPGQKVTHDYVVRNIGEGELVIKDVSPG